MNGIDRANPQSWPVRMLRVEVCFVMRFSQRELRRRVAQNRFPESDDGRTWNRATVETIACKGGLVRLEEDYEKRQTRGGLQVVGGRG